MFVIGFLILNVNWTEYFRPESIEDNLSQAILQNICQSIAPDDVASKSFSLALALTADGYEVRLNYLIISALFSLEEAAAFTVKDIVDEEFELKKRMIEAELKEIDEDDTYNSSYNEGILATKIIGAAESIQELAHSFGNAEVDLSSNINILKKIKLEKERNPQKINGKT